MATVNKDFKVKHGLIVEGSTGTINGSNILTEASTEFLQDTAAGILTGGSHSGISFSYNDATGVVDATVSSNPTFQQSITFEGATANDYETILEVTDPTADRTITLPNATGTVVLKDTTDTLTNKSISLTTNTITGTIAEFNTALTDADFATIAGSETLSNKSISGSTNTLTNIPNNALTNSSITVNGSSVSLGSSVTLDTDDVAEGTSKYFTDERAQDAAAAMITNGSHTNITVTYDDNANTLSLNATGGVASLSGTANEVEVTNVGTAYTVGLPTNVTIAGNLTLSTEGTQATHAVTKAYVDSVTEGLHIHASAVAATTANIDLSTDLENGDVLDGVTLATGNRVLVKNQSNAAQNGIYVVQASGAAVRATDFDAPAEVDGGDFIYVTGGTVNDNTGWVQTSTSVVTIGTDPIEFTQFSGAGTYLAGNGLTLTGNTFAIDTGTTVDLNTTQTLTNKTLTAPKVSGLYLSDNNVVVEGTDDTHETTLTFTDPTQDNTITFKNATGTVAFTSDIPTTTDGLSEGSSNLYFSDERAQDAVAAAIAAGTHSNITITYDDATNKFTFAAENGVGDSTTDNLVEGTSNLYFTTERAEDAVGGMVTGNTETGISVTYDDGTGKLNFAVDDQFPSKSTTNLAEGSNLYFTDARAVSALQAVTPDFPAVEIADVAKQVAATASVTTASTATAVSWLKADYRAAEFLVKIAQGSHTEVSKIILTMDSSDNIAITEYAMVGTNGDLGSVSADIDSSNARLRVTTLNNNSTVTVVGTLLK